MGNVAVRKLENVAEKSHPLLKEIEKRFEDLQHRAFELFERRGREIGHAVEDWLEAEREVFGWPAAEMSEEAKEYRIELTLPGYNEKEIEVTATPSKIVVHAASKAEEKTEKNGVLWTEFGSNEVFRQFEMPQAITPDKVTATLEKGMLRIRAAKAAAEVKEPVAVAAA
jgi:HSP20 family protein